MGYIRAACLVVGDSGLLLPYIYVHRSSDVEIKRMNCKIRDNSGYNTTQSVDCTFGGRTS